MSNWGGLGFNVRGGEQVFGNLNDPPRPSRNHRDLLYVPLYVHIHCLNPPCKRFEVAVVRPPTLLALADGAAERESHHRPPGCRKGRVYTTHL